MAVDSLAAWRALRKSPRFLATAVSTLTLGLTAAVMLSSVYRAVVVRALPFVDADRLVAIEYARGTSAQRGPLSSPAARRVEGANIFAAAADYGAADVRVLKTADGAEAVFGTTVSADFFATLGTPPLYGRWFMREESQSGRNDAVVLSYAFWLKNCGADPDVVGSTLRLDNQDMRVVGIMPEHFAFPDEYVQFWQPRAAPTDVASSHRNHDRWTIARLRDGIGQAQAQAALGALSRELYDLDGQAYENLTFSVTSLQEQVIGPMRRVLLLMWAAVICVLLVACANLANLLLVRSVQRERAIAVLVALGAGPDRVVRMVLTESLLIAGLSTLLALLGSLAGVRLLHLIGPTTLPRMQLIVIDVSAGAVGLLLGGTTAVLAGLLPAWRTAHASVMLSLTGSEASSLRGRFGVARLQQAFCALQLALAVALSIGTVLLLASLYRLQHVPLGFNPDHLINVQFIPRATGQVARISAEELLAEAKRIPGVAVAALTSMPPMLGGVSMMPFRVESQQRGWADTPFVPARVVSGDYFRTLEIPLRRGRTFSNTDDNRAPCVAMINEAAQRAFWLADDPIGRRIDLDISGRRSHYCEIVGVVGDARILRAEKAVAPEFYLHYLQRGDPMVTLLVRTVEGASSPRRALLARALKISSIPQATSVWDVNRIVRDSWRAPRFRALSSLFFAAPALLLAILGVYAVTSFVVSRRIQEVAIRMALGANRTAIVRELIGRACLPILVGAPVGVLIAFASTRVLATLLFDVAPADPLVFVCVPVVLSITALAASYVPAAAAANFNPTSLLQQN